MNVVVRGFDRIAAVEEFASPQRFAELAPNLLQAQILPRDPRDDHVDVIVVGDEHAMNWQRPKRQFAQILERCSNASEVGAF